MTLSVDLARRCGASSLRQFRAHTTKRFVSYQTLQVSAINSSVDINNAPRPIIADVNRLSSSNTELFHRQITGRLRESGKRARKRIRRHTDWIPTNLVGRGKLPDLILQVDPKPFNQDYKEKLYPFEVNQKWQLTGPLYELIIEEGALDEYENMIDISHIPFERVRVLCQNIRIHHMRNTPHGFQLTYAPEDESVRIRIPIFPRNEDKSPGIESGGYLNEFKRYVDVRVDPYAKPPLYATVDVGHLEMKQRITMADVFFEGRDEGCHPIMADDVVYAMVSKI